MNPHLVCAAGLQSTLNERIFSELFQDSNMRDRALPFIGLRGTASAAVATIAHEPRFDALRLHPAADDGEIAALDGMIPELLAQAALGGNGAGEHHEAAGFIVEPVDRANFTAELPRQHIGQSRGQESPAPRAELSSFMGMAHCRQTGRLFDDNDMGVAKADDRLVGPAFSHGL